ncbi:MAG TPA: RDD family protein [Polyangia bacterium]|nr:RDD family protein [Polyangia bacterium]
MSADPNPNFNPYSPPTADTDDTLWPKNDDGSEMKFNADRGSRLGAAIIDGLLYLATMIPAIVVVALIRARELGTVGIVAIVLGIGILPLAIYQWYLVSTTGQTLAKKWLRIRIVKMDGSPVDFMSGVFLRVWLPWLILQALGFMVGLAGGKDFSWIFSLVDCLWIFGAQSRCVHDLIAGTKVVVA